MAEEIYNLSTDNMEKIESSRLNPATGISNFARPIPKISNEKDWRQAVYREAVALKKAEISQKKQPSEVGKYLQESKEKGVSQKILYQAKQGMKVRQKGKQLSSQLKTSFGRLLGAKQKRPVKDQLKVMRLQNMLDKKRLQNQIERLKLAKKVELLKRKGVLKQIISQPIKIPQPIYPAYSTPEIMGDIDSAFNADMSHGDNSLWGNEQYYNENYYDENFYGNEFDGTDPLMHLAIKVRTGVSPLLW